MRIRKRRYIYGFCNSDSVLEHFLVYTAPRRIANGTLNYLGSKKTPAARNVFDTFVAFIRLFQNFAQELLEP